MARIIPALIIILLLPLNCRAQDQKHQVPLTLSQALQTAYGHNPTLLEADKTYGSAMAGVKSARADFFFKASAHYSYTNLHDAPIQSFNGTSIQVSDRNNHHWDVTVTQPLFTGFAITSRYQMARIQAKIKKLEKQRARLDIGRAVKTAWFGALLAKKMEAVAADTVTALSSHERDAQGFYAHGIIPHNDLLKSKVALANAIQEKEQANADAEVAIARLFTLMGVDSGSNTQLKDIDTLLPGTYDLSALIAEALKNRPVLASYRLGLDNLNQAIRLARSSYYPEIALSGEYEQNGRDFGAETNNYSNEHNTAVMVTAKWDFFQWGKTGADVEKQQMAKYALSEKMKGVEDQIRLETKSAYLDLNVAANNIGTAREGLKQAKENARITNLQYRNQITTSTEVLDSRTFLSQAEANYYRALYGYMVAQANLDRAVGRE